MIEPSISAIAVEVSMNAPGSNGDEPSASTSRAQTTRRPSASQRCPTEICSPMTIIYTAPRKPLTDHDQVAICSGYRGEGGSNCGQSPTRKRPWRQARLRSIQTSSLASPDISEVRVDPPTEFTRRRRLLVLAICCTSLLLVSMDTETIVNVALPAIHRELHASLSELQWTLDSYTLVLRWRCCCCPGSTADRLEAPGAYSRSA